MNLKVLESLHIHLKKTALNNIRQCFINYFCQFIIFLQFLNEYIYFIFAAENGGSKSRNVQPMNKGLLKPWHYFPASLLYFSLLNSSSGEIFVYLETELNNSILKLSKNNAYQFKGKDASTSFVI